MSNQPICDIRMVGVAGAIEDMPLRLNQRTATHPLSRRDPATRPSPRAITVTIPVFSPYYAPPRPPVPDTTALPHIHISDTLRQALDGTIANATFTPVRATLHFRTGEESSALRRMRGLLQAVSKLFGRLTTWLTASPSPNFSVPSTQPGGDTAGHRATPLGERNRIVLLTPHTGSARNPASGIKGLAPVLDVQRGL